MKPFVLAAAFAGVAAASPLAGAQMMGHDHSAMGASAAPASKAPQPAKQAEGEVRKVDAARGTIVLRHGPLESLGMPPMTMEFVATDPKLLAGVKVGDKVRFTPAQGKGGELQVTSLEVVKG